MKPMHRRTWPPKVNTASKTATSGVEKSVVLRSVHTDYYSFNFREIHRKSRPALATVLARPVLPCKRLISEACNIMTLPYSCP